MNVIPFVCFQYREFDYDMGWDFDRIVFKKTRFLSEFFSIFF